MENPGIDIQSVQLASGNIVVAFVNGATESYPNTADTYKLFHDKWLKDNPPFISDRYKVQMRNIILASINNNTKCINDMKKYFETPNEETVKKFFTYMRNRDSILPAQKAAWTPSS